MKWFLWAVSGVVILVIAIGWMLPVNHEASRTAHVDAAPGQVYAKVADVAAHPLWRAGITQIEILDAPPDGRIRFREHSTNGAITMEIVEAQPPSRFVTRIADPDQPFGGTWTFDIAPDGSGSTVTITERGEVYNPLFRFMSRFWFGHTAGIEGYLRSLQDPASWLSLKR